MNLQYHRVLHYHSICKFQYYYQFLPKYSHYFHIKYDYNQNNITVHGIKTEYQYKVNEILYWSNLDIAIVAFLSPENLQPIEIANKWVPLMEVYSAGFPIVMGNYKNYRNLFLTDGTLNTVITDKKGEYQANNYTLIHFIIHILGLSWTGMDHSIGKDFYLQNSD